MKNHRQSVLGAILILLASVQALAQSSDEVKTIFHAGPSGGYGVINNKFTSLYGSFANMPEIYGGWFINKKFLIGIGGGATTNYIPVPVVDSVDPTKRMSYLYGQAGLVNEFVLASNSPIHPVIHWFNGAGFSLQYERPEWDDFEDTSYSQEAEDLQWFYITEPGIQIELNLFKWMRLSPGFSYRFAYDNKTRSINKDVSGPSASIALKFGKF